jgi:hypothetical protein
VVRSKWKSVKSSYCPELWYYVFPDVCPASLSLSFSLDTRALVNNDRKEAQTTPDTCPICQNKLHWNQKKHSHIKWWKCAPLPATRVFTLFLMYDANWWRVFTVTPFTMRDTVDFFEQDSQETCPWIHSGKLNKNKMPSSVAQWKLLATVKNTSLHLTLSRQLTDWRKQVTTWRYLRGLLLSDRDIVCLLIQLNCNELQPSKNILMRDGWISITLYKFTKPYKTNQNKLVN